MKTTHDEITNVALRDRNALAIADAILPSEIPDNGGMQSIMRNIRRSERAFIVETLAARLGIDLAVAADIIAAPADDRTPSLFDVAPAAATETVDA